MTKLDYYMRMVDKHGASRVVKLLLDIIADLRMNGGESMAEIENDSDERVKVDRDLEPRNRRNER